MSQYRINSTQPTAIFVHGLHKTGTMFLYQLFQRLSRTRKIAYFSENHSPRNDQLAQQQPDEDFCLCPIRDYADFDPLPEHFRVKQIFHVRDPRDILVSQYFSYGWRHTHEGSPENVKRFRNFVRKNSIDEYVLHQNAIVKPLKERFASLINRPPHELAQVVHYEQMVLNFPAYLKKVLTAFEFPFPRLPLTRFSYRFRNEFKPDQSSQAHKRCVTPGDHINQLKPSTIDQLNDIFEPELRALNYPLDARQPQQHFNAKAI